MYKVLIELDHDKIIRDGIYDIENMEQVIQNGFLLHGITKDSNGFFVGGTFEKFWAILLTLEKEDWFINNVKTWKWYNSDGSSDPKDYGEEDLLAFYRNNLSHQKAI